MSERQERYRLINMAAVGLVSLAAITALLYPTASSSHAATQAEIQAALRNQQAIVQMQQAEETPTPTGEILAADVNQPNAPNYRNGVVVDDSDDRFRSIAALRSRGATVCTANHWKNSYFALAAHCLFDTEGQRRPDSDFVITANTYNLQQGGSTYYSLTCYTHPDYDHPSLFKDVAICEVNDADVSWLPGVDLDLGDQSVAAPDSELAVAAFGRNIPDQPSDGLLREPLETMIFLPNETLVQDIDNECTIFSQYIGIGAPVTHIGYAEHGDSGGPAYIIDENGNKTQVSVITGRCGTGNPDIGTAFHPDSIRNWIIDTFGNNSTPTETPTATQTGTPTPTTTVQISPTATWTPTPEGDGESTPEPDDDEDCYSANDDTWFSSTISGTIPVGNVFANDGFYYSNTNCLFDFNPPRPQINDTVGNPAIQITQSGDDAGATFANMSDIPPGTCAEKEYFAEEQETNQHGHAVVRVCNDQVRPGSYVFLPNISP